MIELVNFDGYIEDEVLGWLRDAERLLETYDSETEHYYPQIKEALQRLEQSRQLLKSIREPIAGLIDAALAFEKEQESWTP